MKKVSSTLLKAIILVSIGSVLSCSGDSTPASSAAENVKKLLLGDGTKVWKINTVTVDDTDQTAKFTDLTIKFSDKAYTTTNGGVVWSSPGTWEFTDSKAVAFYRGDGIEVQVEAAESTMNLSLEWTKTTYGGGRVNSVAGKHVFTFRL